MGVRDTTNYFSIHPRHVINWHLQIQAGTSVSLDTSNSSMGARGTKIATVRIPEWVGWILKAGMVDLSPWWLGFLVDPRPTACGASAGRLRHWTSKSLQARRERHAPLRGAAGF